MCYYVAMNKAVVQLSPDIAQQLCNLCKSAVASVYRNARIILLAADGVPITHIAHALGISARSVKITIRVFRTSGIDGLIGRGSVGRPRSLTSEQRQAIIDLFRHHPSGFGIDRSCWTAADAAMVAEREGIVERISPSTVRRIVAGASLDWHAAKYLRQGKENVCSIEVTEDEYDPVPDEKMSLQGLWTSVCVKNRVDQERLTSIYSDMVRRHGSRDSENHLQLELLSVHLLNALKAQEAGNRESVDKALRIVRSHLEELEREAASRKKKAVPLPGTTPAEIASDLLKRWRRAQDE